VKFIHAADLHLGSPLKAMGVKSPVLKDAVRQAGYKALERIVDASLRHQVDFVVLAGDIYDTDARSVPANRFLIDQLTRLEAHKVPVFLIYGNHDPQERGTEYFRLPGNVHIFQADSPPVVELSCAGDTKVAIWGRSFTRDLPVQNAFSNYQPRPGMVNVALIHAGEVKAEPQILQSIDYWALGHIHQSLIVNDVYPVMAYPGIPQGRDPGETGLGGCLLVELETGQRARLKFIPTASVVWLNRTVAVSNQIATVEDLEEAIRREARAILESRPPLPSGLTLAPGEEPQVAGYAVRWEISGRGAFHRELVKDRETELAEELAEILRQGLENSAPWLWTESVRFKTAPPLPQDSEITENDLVLRELLQMREKLCTDPREIAAAKKLFGRLWLPAEDSEMVDLSHLPLTEEDYLELVSRAYLMALEAVCEGREQSDEA